MTSDAAAGGRSGPSPAARRPALWDVLALLVLAGGLVGVHLSHAALVDPDEPRSAIISRLMVERGGWLVPRLPLAFHHDYPRNPVEGDTFVYWDKPPLFFWLGAAAMQVLGPVPLAARLPSALSNVAAVLLAYAAARMLWGRRAGLMAGAVMALAPASLIMAHVARMETLLMALTAAMLLAVLRLWAGQGRAWVWTVVLYAAAGLGLLTKGPVAVVLPALAVLAVVIFTRRWGDLARLRPFAGVPILLAIAAPWYVYMHLHYPAGADGGGGFSRAFFLSQHFERATADVYGHGGHWPGFLLGVLLVGFIPWTIFLPHACVRLLREGWRECRERPAVMLLFAWAIVTVGAYSFSRTQLPHYVVPAVPPLAILMGAYLAERSASQERNRLFAFGLAVATAAGAGMLGIMIWSLRRQGVWQAGYVGVAAVVAVILVIGSVAIVRRKWRTSVVLLVLGTAALTAFVFSSDPVRVYRRFTTRHEAHVILGHLRPGDRIISYPYTPYSLAWYLWPREMLNPPNEDALAAEINRPVRTLCILHKKALLPRLLPRIHWPTKVLAEPPDRAVVLSDPEADK